MPKVDPQPQPAPAPEAPEAAVEEAAPEAAVEEAAPEAILDRVTLAEAPQPEPTAPRPAPSAPALRMARVTAMTPEGARVMLRGRSGPILATLDPIVERALIERAFQRGEPVLVEDDPMTGEVAVVGLVQTRLPERIELEAEEVVINARREVLLRAGTAALRLREDGDVEVVGSRILTMSRGLFRIVGRVLRLN